MNIIFTSISGNDKTESQHYLRVLRRMGHQVFRAVVPTNELHFKAGGFAETGFSPFTSMESIIEFAGFEPELYLYFEPQGLIPIGIENAPFPTACVLCDTHRNLPDRINLSRFFDHVFLYHCNYLKYFEEEHRGRVNWLPYACDLELFHPQPIERDLDVGFVGNMMMGGGYERKRALDQIRQRWRVNDDRFYHQREIPLVYSRSKIVVNFPLGDDLNFRVFEAMSCGALLLTKRVKNGQEILFKESEHFVEFETEKELFEKIDYYLSHHTKRKEIASAGLAEIMRCHRLEQRIEKLLQIVGNDHDKTAPIRFMSPAQIEWQYAWLFEYMRMVEPALKLVRQARMDRHPWLRLLIPAVRSALRIVLR